MKILHFAVWGDRFCSFVEKIDFADSIGKNQICDFEGKNRFGNMVINIEKNGNVGFVVGNTACMFKIVCSSIH